MIAALALAVLIAAPTPRTPEPRAAFVKAHPCPTVPAGYPDPDYYMGGRGRCPGWIVDHVIPLCAGGADAPGNMQWQREDSAHAKDKIEVQYCRCLDRAPRKMCARVFEHRLREFR